MQLARKIVFYCFVLIYLALCPVIILYSFGYIFQPAEKEISHTGLIYLTTIPPEANVYLGKSRFKNKTPASITELKPGNYQVTVRLRGYRPWTHVVTIEAGKAAAFKNILLLPRNFAETSVVSGKSCVRLIPLKVPEGFIVQKGAQLKEFYIYDRREEMLDPLVGKAAGNKEFTVNSLFTGDKSRAVIFYGGSLWNKKYFLLDPAEKSFALKEVTNLFPEYPEQLIWSGEGLKDVFAVYEGYINRLNLREGAIFPKYFENIKGFGVAGKSVYVLDKDNVIFRVSADKKQKTVLFEDAPLGKDLFLKSRFYEIKKLNQDMLLFRGHKGDLIASIPPYRIADEGILGFKYDEQTQKLLFWSKNTIWTADFNPKEDEDTPFHDRIRRREIMSKGTALTQCFWVYNATHVLFKDKNDVYLLELAPDGVIHKEYLVSVKDKTAVLYSERDGDLYYLNQQGNLAKIKILPKEKLTIDTIIEEERKP